MNDETERYRRLRQAELNAEHASRVQLESQYGQVWSTDELKKDFEVIGFMAPLVIVKEITTGAKGSMEFQHHPRFYFNYVKD